MAHNRDPQKSYRTNRRGRKVTSSSDRSKRSKKSTVPRPTSSSTRASTKGSSKRVTTGKGGTRARVKPKAKSTGLIGSTGNAPKRYVGPPGLGKKRTPGRFTDKPQVKANVKALQNSLPAKLLKSGGKVGAALTLAEAVKAGLTQKPKNKTKIKPSPGMSKPAVKQAKKDAKETNRQSKAASFDRAFASARKAGKTTFTWNGKSYNTKLK